MHRLSPINILKNAVFSFNVNYKITELIVVNSQPSLLWAIATYMLWSFLVDKSDIAVEDCCASTADMGRAFNGVEKSPQWASKKLFRGLDWWADIEVNVLQRKVGWV